MFITYVLYRRLPSSNVTNAGNPRVEDAPNTYEMSIDSNDHDTYSTILDQSEASAPVTSMIPAVTNAGENGRIQPSAPTPRSSANDYTLFDNVYG